MPRFLALSHIPALLAALIGLLPAAAPLGAPLAEPGFEVAAKSALLMDTEGGTLLYAKNIDERHPPASVTKILSMLLIMEAIDEGRASLDDPVRASAHAAGIGGSQVYLKEGETFPLEQMLIAVAVESANDAAVALAEHLYTTEDDFVRIMNARARELGMKNSRFTNVHGLPDPGHYMSAHDAAIAARELILKHPRILDLTSIWTYTLRPGQTELRNTNELIRDYRGADGLKTGHTNEAGWCLVGTAVRNGMRLLSVVFGTASNEARLRETKRLLDYGFRNFERRVVAKRGVVLGRVPVRDAWPARIEITAERDLSALIPRGKAGLTSTRLVPRPGIRAPVAKGTEIADLEILQAGRVVARQPIAAPARIGKANFLVLAWRGLAGWISSLFRRITGLGMAT